MQILPVIDMKAGFVVRGVGGRRDEYRPVQGRLVSSALPLAVARAFRDSLGLHEIYVADLDAIAGSDPAWKVYEDLVTEGLLLWVDAGFQQGRAERLASLGVHSVIAGLESLAEPNALAELIQRLGTDRLVFSLDLKADRALGNSTGWSSPDPFHIATDAVRLGVNRVIVLDLTGVGAGEGVPTLSLCARLRAEFPDIQLTTGGGVRDVNDLRLLKQAGVDYALVASALHDGKIARADIETMASSAH